MTKTAIDGSGYLYSGYLYRGYLYVVICIHNVVATLCLEGRGT